MCTKEMSYTNPYAEVVFDENHNLISLKEKPTTVFDINLGIYVLTDEVRKLLSQNQFHDMPDLFIKAKENGYNVKVFRANDDWMDIGKPNDYLTIRNDDSREDIKALILKIENDFLVNSWKSILLCLAHLALPLIFLADKNY